MDWGYWFSPIVIPLWLLTVFVIKLFLPKTDLSGFIVLFKLFLPINFLFDNDYKGITIWDDINEHLKSWLKNIKDTNILKRSLYGLDYKHIDIYNLREYSWEGGTGVICFGEQEIILEWAREF